MLLPFNLNFRKLELHDLSLLHRWLNTDFVMQWFEKQGISYSEVVEKYTPRILGQKPVNGYVIQYGATPIGYIQSYRIVDFPEYNQAVRADTNTVGLDLFIGHRDYIHRGMGKYILTSFLRQFVFADHNISTCILGPEPGNYIAIRSYQRVGFRYLKTVHLPDENEPEYLMALTRTEFESQGQSELLRRVS